MARQAHARLAQGQITGLLRCLVGGERLWRPCNSERFAPELPRLVCARFPALEELAQQCVEDTSNGAEVLIHLLTMVGSTRTEQEARGMLETGLHAR